MWFPVHQEVIRHPKTKKLSRILKISNQEAVGYLIFLWSWACDYAKDGILEDLKEDIEDGCQWTGEPSILLNALIEARFIIDTEEVGLVINDWDEYGKKCFDKKEQNREKQKRYREKQSNSDITVTTKQEDKNNDNTLQLHNGNVTVTSRLYNPTDKIREEEKREDKKREENSTFTQTEANASTPPVQKIPFQEIVSIFNTTAISLPKIQDLTDKRKSHIKARWSKKPDRQSLDFWKKLFEKVEASDFLAGRSGKWRADFNWITESEDNLAKILEGNYDNKENLNVFQKAAQKKPSEILGKFHKFFQDVKDQESNGNTIESNEYIVTEV